MSVYLNPIANGVMISSLLIYWAFIPMLIHQYRKYGTLTMRKNLVIASFIIYMITAWFMTVMPLPSIEAVNNMNPIQPNIRPFLFVDTFLRNSGFVLTKPGTWITAISSSSFFTVAFNVILTIPFGVYLRKYFKANLYWTIILGLLLSLFYEITQYTGLYGIYPKAYRFADVDDLMVNTFGAVIGYYFSGCIDCLLPNPSKDHEIITDKASFFRRVLSLLVDSITVSALFELGRVVIYWNDIHKDWDFCIFIISDIIVFILIPLFTRNKQTVGMFVLKLCFQDKKGQNAKTFGILLHNLFAAIWVYNINGTPDVPLGYSFIIILFQLLFFLWFIVIVLKSILQRKVCYYWESWLDIYMKASVTNQRMGKYVKVQERGQNDERT